MKLILASQSPRRSDLLSMAEVPFEVIPANCDEETILEDLRNAESEIDWRTVVERLADRKSVV